MAIVKLNATELTPQVMAEYFKVNDNVLVIKTSEIDDDYIIVNKKNETIYAQYDIKKRPPSAWDWDYESICTARYLKEAFDYMCSEVMITH